ARLEPATLRRRVLLSGIAQAAARPWSWLPDLPLRNYPHALTSILRSVCLTTAPALCSGTSTHSCAYPTATGSHATVCAHSCRHMQRYQPPRHGLSRPPALAQLSTWPPTGVQIP